MFRFKARTPETFEDIFILAESGELNFKYNSKHFTTFAKLCHEYVIKKLPEHEINALGILDLTLITLEDAESIIKKFATEYQDVLGEMIYDEKKAIGIKKEEFLRNYKERGLYTDMKQREFKMPEKEVVGTLTPEEAAAVIEAGDSKTMSVDDKVKSKRLSFFGR